MQLLEEIEWFLVLLHFDEVLSSGANSFVFVLFLALDDPVVYLDQLLAGLLEVISPHEVVGDLQFDVNTGFVYLQS